MNTINKNDDNQQKIVNNNQQSLIGWKSFFSFSLEIIKTIIISLAIILPVRYFIIQPFMVDGASMEPNFYDNQYLVVNEISYHFNDPQRGDVIVFKNPDNTKQFYIKRVIALPGETISIKNANIFIKKFNSKEFKKLDESNYLPKDFRTFGNIENLHLGSNEFFVLGDNRNNSRDSRIFGPVKRDLIIGKVWIRGFPFKDAKIFKFSYNYGL